jgi:DNA (cytosine-5)-methyltransferase 1
MVAGNVGHALVLPYNRGAIGYPADGLPMPTMTTRDPVGLVMRNNGDGTTGGWATTPTDEAMRAITTKGHQSLIGLPDQAMLMRNYTARGDDGQMSYPVGEPARTMTGSGVQSLVGWSDADLDVLVDDCTFRMLEPHEVGAAMAFRPDYTVLGNRGERVKQYGNAVTPPAAEVLYRRCVASLEAA